MMLICLILIIIIKIISNVMRYNAIKLMFSLDSDHNLLKDLARNMLRIMVNYTL